MSTRPSEQFNFGSLNDEIRAYLADVAPEGDITQALCSVQEAERRIARMSRAAQDREAREAARRREGVLREPAPPAEASSVLPNIHTSIVASEAEIEQARNIQKKLLPDEMPRLAGFDIASYSRFCRDVGGDYFDFIPLGNGCQALIVADVSGKGVPAAMVMVMFRSILRMVAANGHTPLDTLAFTNHLVQRDLLRGMFITAIYAVLDPAARKLTLLNAGHNPPLLARPTLSGTRAVRVTGPAIGLLPDHKFRDSLRQKHLSLQHGDCLCFYTDGATEAKNLLGEDLGEQALARAFRGASIRPAQQTVEALVAAVDAHQEEAPQHDDITLVVLRVL